MKRMNISYPREDQEPLKIGDNGCVIEANASMSREAFPLLGCLILEELHKSWVESWLFQGNDIAEYFRVFQ